MPCSSGTADVHHNQVALVFYSRTRARAVATANELLESGAYRYVKVLSGPIFIFIISRAADRAYYRSIAKPQFLLFYVVREFANI